MALMHGKNALIKWDQDASNTTLQYGQSWSVDATHDVVGITSMGDSWETFLGSWKDWTATVECLKPIDGVDIGLGGDDGLADDECRLALYLVYDTATPTYRVVYGSAICTGVSVTLDKDDVAKVTYSFQGVGVLTWHSGAAVPA